MAEQVQAMGTCQHEQVGYRKGAELIYVCPHPHGRLWRQVLAARKFRPTAARSFVTA